MNKLYMASATILLLGGVGLFSGAPAENDNPAPEADAVWKYLSEAEYQRNWSHWPGKEPLYEGAEPHGVLLATYVNPVAQEALEGGKGELPEGSIIVKENYTPQEELAAVTVMFKSTGYNPDHNNWFWLKRLANGTVEASGRVDSCQACHMASKRDYLMTAIPE